MRLMKILLLKVRFRLILKYLCTHQILTYCSSSCFNAKAISKTSSKSSKVQPKIHIFESKCRISGRWNPFLEHFSIWNLKRNPKSNCFCSSSLKCQFLITITQVTSPEWMLFATEIFLNIWDVFTNCNGKQHDKV